MEYLDAASPDKSVKGRIIGIFKLIGLVFFIILVVIYMWTHSNGATCSEADSQCQQDYGGVSPLKW